MKTLKAIILNIVFPGAGYLYLKDGDRETIAKFLMFLWSLFICLVLYTWIAALVTSNPYAFSSEMSIPGIAFIMWIGMCVDTYFLAKKRSK